ncbi:MAG: hypothetical protein RL227_2010 [Pseudomonadota bacterium]|jgi:hypothetical protein
MDESMLKGIAVGGAAMVVVGAGAVTGHQKFMAPSSAEVVAVKECTRRCRRRGSGVPTSR